MDPLLVSIYSYPAGNSQTSRQRNAEAPFDSEPASQSAVQQRQQRQQDARLLSVGHYWTH